MEHTVFLYQTQSGIGHIIPLLRLWPISQPLGSLVICNVATCHLEFNSSSVDVRGGGAGHSKPVASQKALVEIA